MLTPMKTAAPTARTLAQAIDLKGGDTLHIGAERLEVFDAEYVRNGWMSVRLIAGGEIVRTSLRAFEPVTVD